MNPNTCPGDDPVLGVRSNHGQNPTPEPSPNGTDDGSSGDGTDDGTSVAAAEGVTSLRWRPAAVAVAVVAVAWLITLWWSHSLRRAGSRFAENANVLLGHFGVGIAPTIAVLAVVLAIFCVWWWPQFVRRASLRSIGWASWALTAAWAGMSAHVSTAPRFADSIGHRASYWYAAVRTDSITEFVATMIDRMRTFPIHVQGHPPLATIFHVWLHRLGLEPVGVGWVIVGIAATTTPLMVFLVRRLSTENHARAVALLLPFATTVLWSAVSFDAVLVAAIVAMAAVMACLCMPAEPGIALARSTVVGVPKAVVVGLFLGALASFVLFSTYGAPVLMAPVLGVAYMAVRDRGWSKEILVGVVVAAAVLGMVTVWFATAGFWWLDGLDVTREAYFRGVARVRHPGYFLLANLVTMALVVGPLVWVGLADRRRWPVPAAIWAAIAGLVAADLSSMSRAEVERIWLPYTPWLMLAATGLLVTQSGLVSLGRSRAAVAVSAALGFGWSVLWYSPW